MKTLSFLLLLLFVHTNVSAQTAVTSPITTNTTWTAAGSPYILGTQYVEVYNNSGEVTLTIEAGVEIQGEYYYTGVWPNYDHSRLVIRENAALVVNGTNTNPVIFTKSPTSLEDKNWGGIIFTQNSRASQSVIDNAIIQFAGGEMEGVIEIYTGTPRISNVTFNNSTGLYIYAENTSTPVIQNCTFQNADNGIMLNDASGSITNCNFNVSGKAIELSKSFPVLSANTFANENFVRINDITTSGTLSKPGTLLNGKTAPYSLGDKSVYIHNAVLTLEAGVVIEGEYYYTGNWPDYDHSHLELDNNASIKILGTEAEPVVFTKSPFSLDNKNWGGLIIHNDANFSNCEITHAVFENGGGEVGGALTIIGGNLSINNCLFRNNSCGLCFDSSSTASIIESSFLTNGDQGILILNNASPSITNLLADSNHTAINVEDASFTMTNSTVQNCESDGIRINNGININIDGCIIRNNYYDGIWVPSNSVSVINVTNSFLTGNDNGLNAYMETGSAITINNCNIIDNSNYGVRNHNEIIIDAKNNWWGDPLGPFDNSDDPNDPTHLFNPGGLGDEVSDFVDYSGWSVVNVKDEITEPVDFTLYQNYPNPFNPTTTIKYSIPAVGAHSGASVQNILLKIYDILGNEVATLVNEQIAPGNYEVQWNATCFASGVYFYRLQAGEFNLVKKLSLIK